jgi:cytochrome oxidase Cu insertion factor (SCO1/SenC/PrrC family)
MKKSRVPIGLLSAVVLLPVLVGVIVYSLLPAGGQSTTLSSASGPPAGPYRGSQPPKGILVPNFALRDYRGNLVRTQALRGEVVLVTFLDTDCKTKCPLIAAAVGDGLRLLSPAVRRQVAPLALTVNPKRDTPTRARLFLRQRQGLNLDFLLGTLKEMRPVWRAFHIVAAAETGSADIHSADVRIYDRRGEWVSTLHLPPDLTPLNVAHDLRTALKLSQA